MAVARNGSPFNEPSPSPHPQPLTKRDVRRNRIMEKLQGVIDSFASNQHQHYRAQLQGVQVDMTLVLRADPYGSEGPLPDSHHDVQELIDAVMKGDSHGNGQFNLPNDEAARADYWNMAGKRYREFVRGVNDAIEARDADLTALHVSFIFSYSSTLVFQSADSSNASRITTITPLPNSIASTNSDSTKQKKSIKRSQPPFDNVLLRHSPRNVSSCFAIKSNWILAIVMPC